VEFDWNPNIVTGGSELTATPEGYDGSPSPAALRIDFTPRFSSAGRTAAAAVLAFEPYISGSLTFPKGVSPELAHAITTFLEPRAVWPAPLDFQPQAIPAVAGVFELGSPVDQWPVVGAAETKGVTRLVLPSSGSEIGHTFGPGFVVLPTNAHLLVPDSPHPLRRLLPLLAAVVLVGADLGVGVVRLPAGVERDPVFQAVAEMLRAVGIRLLLTDPS
jgi:hypothetical protein